MDQMMELIATVQFFLLGSQDVELDRMRRFLDFANGITTECFMFTNDFTGKQKNVVPIRFKDNGILHPGVCGGIAIPCISYIKRQSS